MEDKIWELRNKGYTQQQIADALGISQQSVQKKLKI
jgi:predicted transcriptional regulator